MKERDFMLAAAFIWLLPTILYSGNQLELMGRYYVAGATARPYPRANSISAPIGGTIIVAARNHKRPDAQSRAGVHGAAPLARARFSAHHLLRSLGAGPYFSRQNTVILFNGFQLFCRGFWADLHFREFQGFASPLKLHK